MARGLEHIANIFKKHVTDADGHEDTEKHVLIRKLVELHDKYMVSVTAYSQNRTLFYKTLKEEFESFCGQTSMEALQMLSYSQHSATESSSRNGEVRRS
ncbi:unnamed protein product [Microthlaspi erraticum]|uniref:Cullin N-terminal domain-containing protein n=1 Tax=Microthlaspi erraticum TaxID=1685480 RepID=A0A6D2KKA1_9BRAS|nr:unnamed protein product [Microthlaspi erraticum]